MDKNEPFDFYNHVVGILIKKGIDFNLNFNYNLGYISITTYIQKEEQNESENDN